MARSYMRTHKDPSSGVALAGVKEFVRAGHARENEMKFKCGYPVLPSYPPCGPISFLIAWHILAEFYYLGV
jgi:hypothetical protein